MRGMHDEDAEGQTRPGVSGRRVAERYTLMVVCTTDGNLIAPGRPACTTITDCGVAVTQLPERGRTQDWPMNKKNEADQC